MSPSNVELARRGVEALLAGDWETMARSSATAYPAVGTRRAKPAGSE